MHSFPPFSVYFCTIITISSICDVVLLPHVVWSTLPSYSFHYSRIDFKNVNLRLIKALRIFRRFLELCFCPQALPQDGVVLMAAAENEMSRGSVENGFFGSDLFLVCSRHSLCLARATSVSSWLSVRGQTGMPY